jgi:hypothetical protein
MPVHILALGRVILDHYIFLVPEYTLDEAHLAPVGTAVWQEYRDMLPALTITGNDVEIKRLKPIKNASLFPKSSFDLKRPSRLRYAFGTLNIKVT